jgi:hypothetical protein
MFKGSPHDVIRTPVHVEKFETWELLPGLTVPVTARVCP